MIITTQRPRPLTAKLTEAQLSLVAFYPPIHAADHLAQGWIAMQSALHERDSKKERAHVEYARNRLACAKSEPVARAVKPRDLKAYAEECASLESAINAYQL